MARANDTTNQVDLESSEVDPQALENIRQPWLWRRTWILGAAQTGGSSGVIQYSALWPNSNEEFGSMADGPHVDAKTLRRIRREQRLFFAVSCMGTGLLADTAVGGAYSDQPDVQVYADLRCLGAMRRSNNKSTF